jgi:uncharacterized protein YabE (DUF348 family)
MREMSPPPPGELRHWRHVQNSIALLTSKKTILVLAAVIVASVLLTRVGYADTNKVELSLDGKAKSVRSMGDTVGEVLEGVGIKVGEHDVVAPGLDTPVADGTRIAVRFGRPLDVSVDGKTTRYWVTATDVTSALDQIGVRFGNAALSASRSAGIGRGGLDLAVITPKKLTMVDGAKAPVTKTVKALTVSQALKTFGVKVDSNDVVKPGLGKLLKSGDKVTVRHRGVVTKKVRNAVWDYTTVKQYDTSMYEDESQTIRAGKAGRRDLVIKTYFENGVVVSRNVVTTKTLVAPVSAIVRVGTKKRVTSNFAGGSTVWDALARCESGGNWAINTGNGYYGGLQFNASTWHAYGGSGLPNQNSREEQIRIAEKVRAATGGYGSWPACAASLGLPR